MSEITVHTQAELDAALADPDITDVLINAPDGVWLTVGATGDKSVVLEGGTVERVDSGGTVERVYSGGTVERVDSGGTVERVYSGGTVERVYSGGTVERVYSGGTVEWVDSGGTVERVDSGGTVKWVYSGGTVKWVDSGGTVKRVYSGGTVERAFGTAVIHHLDAGTIGHAGPRVAVYVYSAKAKVQGGLVIDMTEVDLDDATIWCEHNGVTVADGRAVLYKAVDDNLRAGHGWKVTSYPVGEDIVCPDWRDDNNCGHGFHLSPIPAMARTYYEAATRFLRCTAVLADVRPIAGSNPFEVAKAKVRALRVESEVDIDGNELATVDVAAVAP